MFCSCSRGNKMCKFTCFFKKMYCEFIDYSKFKLLNSLTQFYFETSQKNKIKKLEKKYPSLGRPA